MSKRNNKLVGNKQTNKQTNKLTNKQTNKQINKQTTGKQQQDMLHNIYLQIKYFFTF